MANKDAPHGFIPVSSLNGGEPGYVRDYGKLVGYGTALGKYDLVEPVSTGINVNQSAAGGVYAGVGLKYSAASTADTIPVVVLNSHSILEAQEDGDTTPLAAEDESENIDFIVAAANATTGLSQMELNSDTVAAATTTLDFHLLRLAPYIDNVIGANSRWFVVPNNLFFVNQVAGV